MMASKHDKDGSIREGEEPELYRLATWLTAHQQGLVGTTNSTKCQVRATNWT